jgi:hypothetical protein
MRYTEALRHRRARRVRPTTSHSSLVNSEYDDEVVLRHPSDFGVAQAGPRGASWTRREVASHAAPKKCDARHSCAGSAAIAFRGAQGTPLDASGTLGRDGPARVKRWEDGMDAQTTSPALLLLLGNLPKTCQDPDVLPKLSAALGGRPALPPLR